MFYATTEDLEGKEKGNFYEILEQRMDKLTKL